MRAPIEYNADMANNELFIANVRTQLDKKGISIRALHRIIEEQNPQHGMSLRSLNYYLSLERDVPLNAAGQICRALNVRMERMIAAPRELQTV